MTLLVSCFISIANPWFYTAKCGQDGCPACHKVAHRGRADITASAVRLDEEARQAAAGLPTRARNVVGHSRDNVAAKRSWLRRGCGWEREEERGASEMRENPDANTLTPGSFLGTMGVASHSEPYRGTPPMQISVAAGRHDGHVGEQSGVSLGVDVSHMPPKPDPVDTSCTSPNKLDGAKEERKDMSAVERNKQTIGSGQGGLPSNIVGHGSSEMEQTATTSISDATSHRSLPTRPLLDEAISWDRITGVNGGVCRDGGR
ncbi:hypothetical protein FRC07_005907 [Ceratobasidium sp. 392]|nr:hypothetical protein FRC07_005907 [Ceratobasidium sp. 392]